MYFAGEGGAACGDRPLSDSRPSLPGQLHVPWVRVDHTKISEHVKEFIFSAKLRISVCEVVLE